jgi:hypothetical protein
MLANVSMFLFRCVKCNLTANQPPYPCIRIDLPKYLENSYRLEENTAYFGIRDI